MDGVDPRQLALDFMAPIPPGAYDGVEQAEQNTEDGWRAYARAELEVLARTGLTFTADDLVKVIGAPDHPNRIGAAFLSARKAGIIEPTGEVRPSTTPSRHGSLVRVWKGSDNPSPNPSGKDAA
ncbi:hypothetical protein GCM10009804_02990 [Kribbella hippodromi]|uniref:DUF3253 domain-containing protein n=1 Tax=Kribbella hippodromi TaxID=434347 RepID=A0ABN2BZZ5_9ACTN